MTLTHSDGAEDSLGRPVFACGSTDEARSPTGHCQRCIDFS